MRTCRPDAIWRTVKACGIKGRWLFREIAMLVVCEPMIVIPCLTEVASLASISLYLITLIRNDSVRRNRRCVGPWDFGRNGERPYLQRPR